jgi:hypothetical protein
MTESVSRQSNIGSGVTSPPTQSLNNNVTVDVTIGSGARVGPYYPGPGCTSVWIVSTGGANIEINGSGGSGGLADSVYRLLVNGWGCKPPTATKAGVIEMATMPWRFYLIDTSSTSNPTTMYFMYN